MKTIDAARTVQILLLSLEFAIANLQMELKADELESNQEHGILLPISQNESSTQQANIGASSLTPAQKARMAHQKEMALAKYRQRHQHHHQPPQRHGKLAMASSPCTQLPTIHTHKEPAVDMLNNITADAQMILQVRKYSQKYPFVPTSDYADSCFYQDRHSFTQAKSDRADSCFYQERHSFTQAKPLYISGSCYPKHHFSSGSTAASLTQSNTISYSGDASFTQTNLNCTHTNAGVAEANIRQETKRPHGVLNEASEKLCHQAKRPYDWDCDTSKGLSSVDESELKRALSFNPRVDVTSLSERGEPILVPEAGTSNPRIALFSDSGFFFPSVSHSEKWLLRSPRADIDLLQNLSKKDDFALDHHKLNSEAEDYNNELAYVDESAVSDCAGGSQYCEVPKLEQDIQACHLAASNICSNGKQGFTRSPRGGFEVAKIFKPVITSFSEEDGGNKVQHECHQSGRGGGKGADIIELSDDDGGTGKAVVIELSDDDKSTVKGDVVEVSGASQEVTSSATLGSLYQTKDRGFYDNTYQYTNSTVSRKEQDLADVDITQRSLYNTDHELVRSADGFIYYRMLSLEDDKRKSTTMFKSEPHDLEEEDDTFIPLTVLPSALSKQQQLVLRAVAAGKSIFLTGAAGTGKSFLLGFVINILRRHLGQQSVFVTASTGLAACALNGTTIHSFAGIGLGQEKPDHLVSKVMGSREAMSRWRNARALIIDEISMIDGELFDKLDHVAKVVRAELLRDEPLNKSFGGIQLVVTGDFFQLPPVKPVNQKKFFAFEADCWDKCFDVQIELKQIFRQDDGNFVGMLNKIRRGTHTPDTLLPLQKCIRDLPENGSGIEATRLYPLKHDVNQENISTLRMLNREIVEFTALDKASSSYYRSMLQYMRAGNTLPLCIGAQVMLVKNLDTNSGLVNGARGVVVGFSSLSVLHDKDVDLKAATAAVSPNGQWPVVQFACDASQRVIGPHKDTIEDGGMEVASRIQVPLFLAWALSVHKCQGMTLDRVKMDLSRAFGFGMVYVALSRVKNLNGLQLTGLNPSTIKAHPRVVQFYTKLDSKVLTAFFH